ncbi:YitT family protein [Ramlibacter monticola]|uniref:YitT family protein n=1 Tax=Ramlibacter monticola TaxID=1926872 RepID=A0A936Z445_9BURK|nr:YitT family protein [Ramlibacter monticola]MBL0394528.1 YitT family protein [Ramlibacter monticola]
MVYPRFTLATWKRLQDDVQGLLTGTLFVALGVFLMKSAGLVPGGLVGLALLLHYGTGLDLGAILFLVNLPFYLLAWTRMGRAFTVRTAIAVSLLSLLSWWLPRAVALQQIDGALAAVLGGLLCGAGMLIIFRHRASLGGLNVLVLRLQDRFGWPPGKTQMAIDALIVLGGGWYVGDAHRLALSILAVVALNLALVYNHRPGCYQPV